MIEFGRVGWEEGIGGGVVFPIGCWWFGVMGWMTWVPCYLTWLVWRGIGGGDGNTGVLHGFWQLPGGC